MEADFTAANTTISAASIVSPSAISSVPFYYEASKNATTGGGGGDAFEDEELEWLNKRLAFFILLAVYLLVIVGGVLGNGSILMTLFTSGRVPRNPLLVALCFSDFFVSGISAPITVSTSAFIQHSWRAGPTTCKTMYFLQVSGSGEIKRVFT